MHTIKKLLICRSDRIGDLVLTLPLFAAARKALPDAHIAALVAPPLKVLLDNNPNIDSVLVDDRRGTHLGLSGFTKLFRQIAKKSFDAALLPYCNWRQAAMMRAARIPLRVANGYRSYLPLINRPLWLHRSHPPVHESDYCLAFLEPLGLEDKSHSSVLPKIYLSGEEIASAKEYFAAKGINLASDKVIGLHPGCGGSAHNLSPDKWAHIGSLVSNFASANKILLTGSNSERTLAERIKRGLGDRAVISAGDLSLRELCAVLHNLELLIAPSTGPLHVAAAVGTPVIGLYPPSLSMSPVKWKPLGPKVEVVVPLDRTCNSCSNEKCSYFPCMDHLKDEQLLSALERLFH